MLTNFEYISSYGHKKITYVEYVFVYQQLLIVLLKPLFRVKGRLFQFKPSYHKLKTVYFFFKNRF